MYIMHVWIYLDLLTLDLSNIYIDIYIYIDVLPLGIPLPKNRCIIHSKITVVVFFCRASCGEVWSDLRT